MDQLWAFLNSSFFIAIITLGAGLIAYWLYRKKNKDYKKDAANILLLEIQNAERQLKVSQERMQKDGGIADNAYVMTMESWSKYKYLFVRDFDRDEWDTINSFYDKCRLYDDAVSQKSAAFKNNEAEIRRNLHRVTSSYVNKLIDDKDLTEEKRNDILTKIDSFQDQYLGLRSDLTLYQPSKPINDAKLLLESIDLNLTQTVVGSRLKALASLKPKV